MTMLISYTPTHPPAPPSPHTHTHTRSCVPRSTPLGVATTSRLPPTSGTLVVPKNLSFRKRALPMLGHLLAPSGWQRWVDSLQSQGLFVLLQRQNNLVFCKKSSSETVFFGSLRGGSDEQTPLNIRVSLLHKSPTKIGHFFLLFLQKSPTLEPCMSNEPYMHPKET